MGRLIIVPEESFEPMRLVLRGRLSAVAGEIRAENLGGLLGSQSHCLLLGLVRARPDCEAILWGCGPRILQAAWTSLAPQEAVIGVATAHEGEGLIARVLASGSAETEIAEALLPDEWTNLGRLRHREIVRMAGAPVHVFNRALAALTLVQYLPAKSDAPPDRADHAELVELSQTAGLLGCLIEDYLLRAVLGLGMP